MKRIWHHYLTWEDYKAGMWRDIPKAEKANWLVKAESFTGDANLYSSWMIQVVKQWPIACEHNLTDRHLNRQAWIGHAAVCMAIGCPEDITREAWWKLTEQQRDEANAKADQAIGLWETKHAEKN